MRIERINDNQIRCTLSKHDLTERHLKISELAYGSDKAKELFRDMMEQANMDFGFEADDIPLMIEAIPTSKESIVLVITKVEDPDEFEEKFSKFGNLANKFDTTSDESDDYYDYNSEEDTEEEYQGDLINCFEQLNELIENASETNGTNSEFVPLHEILKKGKKQKKSNDSNSKPVLSDHARIYSFSSLNIVIGASKAIVRFYSGQNSMWKDESNSRYYLFLSMKDNKTSFDKVCSILNEFGKKETLTYATQDYFNEHYKLIIKDDAITKLSSL